MDRVKEIELAIGELRPEEYQRLSKWFHDRDQAIWDEQIDRDAAAGKLDFLSDKAERELAQNQLRTWPARD
jgi:hypothetical protein